MGVAGSVLLVAVGILTSTWAMKGVSDFRYAAHIVAGENPYAVGEPASEKIPVALFWIVLCWITVIWCRRLPLLPIIAGTFLTVVLQLDILLLAVGLGYWTARDTSRWYRPVIGSGPAVMIFAIIRSCLRSPDSSEMVLLSGSTLPSRSLIVTASILLGMATVIVTIAAGLGGRARRRLNYADEQRGEFRQYAAGQRSGSTGSDRREVSASDAHDSLAHQIPLLTANQEPW